MKFAVVTHRESWLGYDSAVNLYCTADDDN